MERYKIEKRHRKRAPRVPIKTYKWEDIRRARLKGGYPWTYLYKEPFNEHIDPKNFKMATKQKNTVTTVPQKNSEDLKDIKKEEVITEKNIETNTQETFTPEPSSYIVITEVPSDQENHSKGVPRGSVTIEDLGEVEPGVLESAESSDNISQYLDKEEPTVEPQTSTIKPENGRQERAKSEEPATRKRKLSIDSSYSRKSLSKLAIIKKLKEAKAKIKVPKINFPSIPNLPGLSKQNDEKKEASKKTTETKNVKSIDITTHFQPNKNAKPVYIHIPLKPPEGQTDEFSYLEFGEKKPEVKPEEKPKETEEAPKAEEKPPTIEISAAYDNDERRFSGDPDDIVAFEIVKTETIDLEHAAKNGFEGGNDYLIIEQDDDEKSESRSMIIIMSGNEDNEPSKTDSKRGTLSRQGSQKALSRQGSKKLPSRQGSRKVRAKSAEPERKRKLSADSSYSRISLSKEGLLKKLKETKDKIKQQALSLTGSESKKSSNKKAKDEVSEPVKEIKPEVKKSSKEEPKYIHIPLKPPPGETDEFSHLEFEEKKEVKPEEKPAVEEEKPIESPVESPVSPNNEQVQFIFLSPPSDDEVLENQPEIPETPSEDKKSPPVNIDELKQIAKQAVDVATPESKRKLQPVSEEGSSEVPPSTTEITDTKKEKQKDKKKKNEKDNEIKEEVREKKSDEPNKEKLEKMVVDEEDGLKLTESAMAKQEQNIKAKEITDISQELKSSLKTDGSPVLKKKVSFKRRSKDDSKDGDYEEVQTPADDKSSEKKATADEHKSKLAVMGNSQSMSAEEEKSYLDEKKIIKTTSLEEDYNRWSKLGDHEYEPVNPPPDNVSPAIVTTPPTVHISEAVSGIQPKATSQASSTTSLERRMLGAEVDATPPQDSFTVQEIQSAIEDKYFGKTAETTPSKPKTIVHTITTITTSETQSQSPKHDGPGKFQQAIKTQTDKFKTKLHEIKKPNIKLPSRPHIKKPNFKFEKPKMNMPKFPDTSKISLPTFSLPRRNPLKRTLKQRQYSTESNAGGSKKNYFDFRTYPRLFKKNKPKDDFGSFSSKSEREVPEFATVPRTKRNKVEAEDRWGGRDSIRIPLHGEDSIEDDEREDSVERRMASHMRYDQDIDIDDAYEKENQEIHAAASPFSHDYNSRWNHGSFHPHNEQVEDTRNQQITDLDSPDDGPAPHESFDTNTNTSKDIHSSESSLGIHRRGVLEEIDSDEFFLRQKGISQDNIEVGMYLSSEIREAFKSPNNALADLQREPLGYSYDARASNQSLPETPSKRKAMKKPKRKKTPHVSQEQISFDQDSELDNELPPPRPKRRSKRSKKRKDPEMIIPYQETIAVDVTVPDVTVDILQTNDDHEKLMYENELMEGKGQPEIKLSDPYDEYRAKYDSEEDVLKEETKPSAPPRKHRSLKSLNYSEHDSILGDVDPDREPLTEDIEIYKTEHEYIIPTPEVPPIKPPRTLSRSSLKSHDQEESRYESEEPPVRPSRTRSRSRTRSHANSLSLDEPCVEELCVQDFRDSMGYAVVDKNVRRDPPLPPPKTTPRRRRSEQSTSSETKFFTVPRPLNDETPVRPLRNYSTLGPSRPPRRKPPVNMTDEEKENIDITQYIEIEDEPNRDLHSGEVIQKMKDRPLPAPPRPPRKKGTLQDITSQENIVLKEEESAGDEEKREVLEETEVSTQTEPLPDDVVCEEATAQEDVTQYKIEEKLKSPESVTVEKRLLTPTNYTYEEETITHGSLVVEPLNGARILPDSELTRREKPVERNVPVIKDYDDETSEIPEEFTKLKDPESTKQPPSPIQPSIIERIIERPVLVQPDSNSDVEVLKAQKLQVSDLDVDRLSVNELLASRIVVSEIESGSIQANEISSKSGALKVGEIELPPGVVQQLFEKLQSVAQEQQSSGPIEPVVETSKEEVSEDAGQKKTPFEQKIVETLPPQRPPRKTEEMYESSAPTVESLTEPRIDIENNSQTDSIGNIVEREEVEEPPKPPVRAESMQTQETEDTDKEAPQRPPRHCEKNKSEEISTLEQDETKEQQMPEPEVDDEPPPRPPQPQIDYLPSQPPPSFYALRAQKYVESFEGDIPMAPRRRRHHKPPPSQSSSDDSPAPPPSRRRYKSPEPSIPQLTSQLLQACGSATNNSIKRLIAHITNNVLRNADGQQDLHVMIIILLVLIAGLILLGYGDGKTVHYHHWEFFNPPGNL